MEPERFIDGGDTVVVQGRHRGRSVSGNPIDLPFMHLWTLRDGKATSFTEVLDSATAVQALGAGPAGGVDVEAMLRRMFDEIINQGRLEVVDELFAEDYVDHGPMGDMSGREALQAAGRPVARRRPGRALRGRHGDRAGRPVRAGWCGRRARTPATGSGSRRPAGGSRR